MKGMTKFATETAKLVKEFASMSNGDEEAQQEFCSELSNSDEDTQASLKLLFDAAKEEMSKLRRSEKSDGKSSSKTDGDDNVKKGMTKKQQIFKLLNEGTTDKGTIQQVVNCNPRTVTKAISEYYEKSEAA